MTSICGVIKCLMDLRVRSVAATGTASKTMSAPATASQGRGRFNIDHAHFAGAFGGGGRFAVADHALDQPTCFKASANEPPIKPQPIKPSCSNIGVFLCALRRSGCHRVGAQLLCRRRSGAAALAVPGRHGGGQGGLRCRCKSNTPLAGARRARFKTRHRNAVLFQWHQ